MRNVLTQMQVLTVQVIQINTEVSNKRKIGGLEHAKEFLFWEVQQAS